MRYLLVLLLLISLGYAKTNESCYTVQLESFVVKKNSTFDFENRGYPKSCQYFVFKKVSTIRCGCYEKFRDAKVASKTLSKLFPGNMIVTTNKHRSLSKKSEHIEDIKTPQHSEETTLADEITSIEENEPYNFQDDVTVQGNLDLTAQYFSIRPEDKHSFNFTGAVNLEVEYNKDDLKLKTKLHVQNDLYDYKKSSQQNGRSFARIDELYAKYDFEDEQIIFGKDVRFWGALEVRNITDNFNSDELRADPFETDKLGSWNATYTYFTDNGEFSVIAKFYEQSRKMSSYPYVYYYFPQNITTPQGAQLPLEYNNNLNTQASEFRPSLYLKYAASTDTEYALDYAVIFENGYDSQRYYTTTLSADTTSMQTNENAYLVNKLITYNTLVVESTLIKLEAVYTDVINDKEISDYLHIGLGVEHSLTQVYEGADLGLIAEYYNYTTFESEKRSDLELFELFQNDLFLGLRYTLNQGNDASIVAGTIIDLSYDEEVYYLEYETRFLDTVKVNFDYRYINPSSKEKTAFNLMGRHERISLKIGYYF